MQDNHLDGADTLLDGFAGSVRRHPNRAAVRWGRRTLTYAQLDRAATRMAILSKFQDQEAVILDELKLPQPKTKEMAAVVKALNLKDTTCLVGIAGQDPLLFKASRNLPKVKLMPADQFNAYTVLRQKRLVLTRSGLEKLRHGTKTEVTPAAPAAVFTSASGGQHAQQ